MLRSQFLASALAATVSRPASLTDLERRSGGRLGVLAMREDGTVLLQHRAGERFPMCSTFKVMLVSALLKRVDRGEIHLADRLTYGKTDLLSYAPITRVHVARGWMTVSDLCAAAIEVSDNTAANLLLRRIGGPAAVTSFARSIGDSATRLDRNEPSLNSAIAGDPRDTTTPRAYAQSLARVVLGDALSPACRDHLKTWMLNCQTGDDRLRAGVARGWRVADKTGSGDRGTANDVAVMWPPNGQPIVVTAYLTQSTLSGDDQDGILKAVGAFVAAAEWS
jgi:beta-lactamase class A